MKNINQSALNLALTNKRLWVSAITIAFTFIFVPFKLIAKTSEAEAIQAIPEQRVVHETDLNTVYLTNDSRQKLGIEVATVQLEAVVETKSYGGEIVVPTGSKVSISAPVSGKLIALDQTKLTPGASIKAGQLLYRIEPIITADARANLINALADANSLVNTANSQVEATNIALKRAKKLLKDLVGSQRNVDEASAANELALRNLEAASAKKKAINAVAKVGAIKPIDIKSPQAGIVSNVFAVSNQIVSVGNPMIEVSDLSSLWVRIPIPLGDLHQIDQGADAKISPLSASVTTGNWVAQGINAPPTADPLTNAAHLYYVIDNKNAAQNIQPTLRPAERVSVTLNTFSQSTKHLTVPWASVVVDIHGGNWVYIQKTNNTFERKRVFVDYVDGETAILNGGLKVEQKVVINGALELFGVETGFTH